MAEKKNVSKFHLSFTDREIDILTYIDKKEGERGLSTTIHNCITNWYLHKYYDKRAKDTLYSEDEPIDPRERAVKECERRGGHIKTNDSGIEVCIIPQETNKGVSEATRRAMEQSGSFGKSSLSVPLESLS